MDEFGKVGAETSYLQSQMHSYDTAKSIADSDLEDGALRKKSASPLYRQDREDCKSSRTPTAPGKPAAMIQERGASAKRTQADHSRRQSLISSSSQEHREQRRNLLQCFRQEVRKSGTGKSIQEFNFKKKLIRQIWEDLFSRTNWIDMDREVTATQFTHCVVPVNSRAEACQTCMQRLLR